MLVSLSLSLSFSSSLSLSLHFSGKRPFQLGQRKQFSVRGKYFSLQKFETTNYLPKLTTAAHDNTWGNPSVDSFWSPIWRRESRGSSPLYSSCTLLFYLEWCFILTVITICYSPMILLSLPFNCLGKNH